MKVCEQLVIGAKRSVEMCVNEEEKQDLGH